jgi:hypothetical protein
MRASAAANFVRTCTYGYSHTTSSKDRWVESPRAMTTPPWNRSSHCSSSTCSTPAAGKHETNYAKPSPPGSKPNTTDAGDNGASVDKPQSTLKRSTPRSNKRPNTPNPNSHQKSGQPRSPTNTTTSGHTAHTHTTPPPTRSTPPDPKQHLPDNPPTTTESAPTSSTKQAKSPSDTTATSTKSE